MKVLHANKFYYLQGGTERYFLETMELLEKSKVECVPFAMKHEKNLPSPFSSFFVSHVDFSKLSFSLNGFKALARMFYSFEAKEKVEKLVIKEKPDIVHLHNIYHQISPSILGVFRRYHLPVVMTVHDHKLYCPNYLLFTHGKYCTACRKRKYYQAVKKKCLKNSYLASSFAAAEMSFHKLFRFYEKGVDQFIAPSVFVKEMMLSFGFKEEKITVLPHYVDFRKYPYSFTYDSQNPYIIFWGRHREEKGLKYLLQAVKNLPRIRLIVCGEGPEDEELKSWVKLNRLKNVIFVGFVTDTELSRLVRDAEFVVVPSVFPENFGLVIIEAFAYGKPVITAKRGAPKEIVDDGLNGYLCEAQNSVDLADKILKLWNQKDLILEMGKNARNKVEKVYAPRLHVEKLMNIYQKNIKLKKHF